MSEQGLSDFNDVNLRPRRQSYNDRWQKWLSDHPQHAQAEPEPELEEKQCEE